MCQSENAGWRIPKLYMRGAAYGTIFSKLWTQRYFTKQSSRWLYDDFMVFSKGKKNTCFEQSDFVRKYENFHVCLNYFFKIIPNAWRNQRKHLFVHVHSCLNMLRKTTNRCKTADSTGLLCIQLLPHMHNAWGAHTINPGPFGSVDIWTGAGYPYLSLDVFLSIERSPGTFTKPVNGQGALAQRNSKIWGV